MKIHPPALDLSRAPGAEVFPRGPMIWDDQIPEAVSVGFEMGRYEKQARSRAHLGGGWRMGDPVGPDSGDERARAHEEARLLREDMGGLPDSPEAAPVAVIGGPPARFR